MITQDDKVLILQYCDDAADGTMPVSQAALSIENILYQYDQEQL